MLVLIQAGLGGLTVEHSLKEELVAAHLGTAMVLLGLLLWLSFKARSEAAAEAGEPVRQPVRGLKPYAATAAVLLLCAIVAGGYMAGTEEEGVNEVGPNIAGAHLACGQQFPTCGDGKFLPFGNNRLTDIHLTHRVFVYAATIAIVALLAVAFARGSRDRLLLIAALLLARPGAARRAQRLARRARPADRCPPHRGDSPLGDGGLDRLPGCLAAQPCARSRPATASRGIGGAGMSVHLGTGPERVGRTARRARAATQVSVTPGDARTRTMRAAIGVANDYVTLTKPRIISLLLLTCVATMFVADPSGPALSTILWTCLGGYLAAGGAGAINHYIEREPDARMARTRGRPLASGRIEPRRGLLFGSALGIVAVVQLAITVNALTAALAAAGLLGYVFVYTLWLKPRTPQNIVLGGAAGAMPPLVGWAAATGGLSAQALWPFAIVFFWTPPHFWALSLLISDDYARTGVPMLPVVRGETTTRHQIVAYALLLVAVTIGPVLTGLFGTAYLVAALALGAGFVGLALVLLAHPTRQAARRLYLSSLAYLALLFVAMALDRALIGFRRGPRARQGHHPYGHVRRLPGAARLRAGLLRLGPLPAMSQPPEPDRGRFTSRGRRSFRPCSPSGSPPSSSGLFAWWPYSVIGGLVALFSLIGWLRANRGRDRAHAAPPAHGHRPDPAVGIAAGPELNGLLPRLRLGAPSRHGGDIDEVAPNSVQQRTMSRIESTPTSSPRSTTTR